MVLVNYCYWVLIHGTITPIKKYYVYTKQSSVAWYKDALHLLLLGVNRWHYYFNIKKYCVYTKQNSAALYKDAHQLLLLGVNRWHYYSDIEEYYVYTKQSSAAWYKYDHQLLLPRYREIICIG